MKEIKSMEERYVELTSELLDEAKSHQYTNVIIIGFKDGKIYTALTKNELLQTLGALEIAKAEILLDTRE